jgi:hypothetical protein
LSRLPISALLLFVPALVLAASGSARADEPIYAIAIGSNAPPSNLDEHFASLRYADDDAAAFIAFLRPIAARVELLTTFDAESQRRFPGLVPIAREPTLRELRRVVDEIRRDMAADVSAGRRPILFFFYSGHGTHATDTRSAALTLADEGLTRERLYSDILATLPAAAVHLFADACYAEDVVQPRDLQLNVVTPSSQEIEHVIARTTLARFPHVGAILAAAATGQTHEWDLYRQGVFTHELLSGLRGAADVNGDGLIEYSELTAFLAAANREVSDPRARLQVVAHAPVSNRRLPIIDLRRFTHATRLRPGRLARFGPGYYFIEDDRGNRLVEMRAEESYDYQLYLPAGEPLYFVSATKTLEFTGAQGEVLSVDKLVVRRVETQSRGALASALRRGLFAASFGPNYYRGFVDSSTDMASVDFPESKAAWADTSASSPAAPTTKKIVDGWVISGCAAAATLGAVAVGLGILADRARDAYNGTTIERSATDAGERFDRDRSLAITTGVAAAIATAATTWLIWRRTATRPAGGGDFGLR